MRIERPWKDEGDYFEIIVYDAEDWARMMERLREHTRNLTPDEKYAAATRYMRRKLGIEDDG